MPEKAEKKRYGRESKTVSIKMSPIVYEKFKAIAEREQLPISIAVEILMSEAIERGYIDKAREVKTQ
mgnify:CR=1 FL=1